jgi:hypothetical protein
MPRSRRIAGSSARGVIETSLPNTWINPRVGRSARYMSLSRVVLPAPLDPVRKWNDPGAREKFTSRNTSGPTP